MDKSNQVVNVRSGLDHERMVNGREVYDFEENEAGTETLPNLLRILIWVLARSMLNSGCNGEKKVRRIWG